MTLDEQLSNRNNNFNMIRVLLALMVVYGHSFYLTGSGVPDYVSIFLLNYFPAATIGGLAVQVFFFLSGLFVTISYIRDPRLLSFTVRRVMRIYPAYFIMLLLTLIFSIVISSKVSLVDYLSSYMFYEYVYSNFFMSLKWSVEGVFGDNAKDAINGSIHTLPLELKMYILLGLVGSFGIIRKSGIAFLLIIILILITGLIVYGYIDRNSLLINFYDMDYSAKTALCFFFGCLTALASKHIKIKVIYSLALLVLCIFTNDHINIFFNYVLLFYVILLVGCSALPLSFGTKTVDPSYGAYLYGWPIQQSLLVYYPQFNPYELFIFAGAISVLAGALSYVAIEKLFIKLGSGFSKNNYSVSWFASNVWSGLSYKAYMISAYLSLALVIYVMSIVLPLNRVDSATVMDSNILEYGPKETKLGVSINEQPNGDSAIWLTVDRVPPPHTVIMFGTHRLNTIVGSDNVVTAVVPDSIINTAGNYNVFLLAESPQIMFRSNIVPFVVAYK